MNLSNSRTSQREPESGTPPRRPTGRRHVGAVIAIAVVAGVITWVLVDRSSPPSSSRSASSATTTTASGTSIEPVELTAASLGAMSRTLGEPIYWAGPQKGYRYEFRRTTSGDSYVRYLPRGVKAGVAGAGYLTVATYPYPAALHALEAVAHGKSIRLPGGGIAVVDSSHPQSVHLAFPRVPFEIEVYDPRPAVSRAVAVSGRVRPVR